MNTIASLTEELQRAEIAARLLPRRRAILETIQEQLTVSFDFIQRNFAGTPASTLRYELLQLQKLGLIKKLGVTRGALYSKV